MYSNEHISFRFFEAIYKLKEMKIIKSKADIYNELQVHKSNFRKQELDHARTIIQPCWLSLLIVKYNVSAEWLMTGKGSMFTTAPLELFQA